MSVIWIIKIGAVAGVAAKFLLPGDNEPSGFILTTILRIIAAFVATYLGGRLACTGRQRGGAQVTGNASVA